MLKRKRMVLSLEDKINIIDSLKKGESGCKLAHKYGVGRSTISDIKKNTYSILKYTCKLDSENGSKHRKIMKKPKNERLEDALYCWFLQKRSNGQPISGPILCQKALQLNKKIGGDESFVASSGWLYRFKSRHAIRGLKTQGERITADAANSFQDNSKKKLDENDCNLNFDSNTDETILNQRPLSKTVPSQQENSVPQYETSNILQLKIEQETQEDELDENVHVENDAVPSHEEAYQALETALKWFERQTECDTVSLLQLQRIHDLAAMKAKTGLRQMKITNYFHPLS